MRKYIVVGIFTCFSVSGFCQQMTRISNAWDVQNHVVNLQNWGCTIYRVYCENPYAPREDQRWVIVYDQK